MWRLTPFFRFMFRMTVSLQHCLVSPCITLGGLQLGGEACNTQAQQMIPRTALPCVVLVGWEDGARLMLSEQGEKGHSLIALAPVGGD